MRATRHFLAIFRITKSTLPSGQAVVHPGKLGVNLLGSSWPNLRTPKCCPEALDSYFGRGSLVRLSYPGEKIYEIDKVVGNFSTPLQVALFAAGGELPEDNKSCPARRWPSQRKWGETFGRRSLGTQPRGKMPRQTIGRKISVNAEGTARMRSDVLSAPTVIQVLPRGF